MVLSIQKAEVIIAKVKERDTVIGRDRQWNYITILQNLIQH